MFFWFAGLAVVLVWVVFRDPAIDYRLVMAGAVAPIAVDGLLGGARLLHTLVFSVALLIAVMLATRRRRLLRRRLLALPIGTFLHLVLDGMWTRTETFWWPAFGTEFADALPVTGRPVWLIVAMEIVGLGALLWCRSRFRLDERDRLKRFLRTGRLGRDLRPGAAPSC